MPAVGRRHPCCGFIYCSIPAAARLRSAVQSPLFSVTPPLFVPTHFDSYLSHGLFPSWMFIPFTALFIICQPPSPSPYASTSNHSLLVVVYWYPFFTFLIPTILLLFLFSHFVTPLLPSTDETFFVVPTAFPFGHTEFVSYRISMFHRAFFNSVIDKHQHMHFFIQNCISLKC